MITAQPRLVVSAPSSGHGKTAIAVGLLAALSGRGVPTAGFKVGPDHTDAAYLGLAAGRPGRNLDPRLVGAQRVAPLFAHGAAGAQVAVIEGAMGLFDSLTGQPEIDGTASVAATLRAPVVLVVDVAAMGHSLAALVHGFRMFDEMVHLGGVILNRVASDRHEQMLRSAMDDIGMPVLGALHRGDLPNVLPARTHGLVPVAHRTVEAGRAVRRLGEAVAGSLDMDRLMALASSAPPIPGPIWTPAEAAGDGPFDQRPLIALAGGQGAPYTYVETAELLTAAGADVAVVDPLRDETLPPGTRALVVGAGLPEGYAEELSANRRLCAAVAQFARDGWPVVAEGVALPWLGHELDGRPMCGVLDATAVTAEQTVAGYREATAPATSVLAPAGARITGYKQHRAVVTPRAGANPAWTWSGGNPEGFVWRQVHASQLGLHWAAAPEIARRLVAAAHAGPQGASGAQNATPAGIPSGPPSGISSGPSGTTQAGHPGMPPFQPAPAGQGSPPVQGSPAAPATPQRGEPVGAPAGMLSGQAHHQGQMLSGPPTGLPAGQPVPRSGIPGQGFPSSAVPGYGHPDSALPGYGHPDSALPGYGHPDSGFPGHGHPDAGTPGHGSPGAGISAYGPLDTGFNGPNAPGPGGSGYGHQDSGFPGQNAAALGGSGYAPQNAGLPGQGAPGSGSPGHGRPGQGTPTSSGPTVHSQMMTSGAEPASQYGGPEPAARYGGQNPVPQYGHGGHAPNHVPGPVQGNGQVPAGGPGQGTAGGYGPGVHGGHGPDQPGGHHQGMQGGPGQWAHGGPGQVVPAGPGAPADHGPPPGSPTPSDGNTTDLSVRS